MLGQRFAEGETFLKIKMLKYDKMKLDDSSV